MFATNSGNVLWHFLLECHLSCLSSGTLNSDVWLSFEQSMFENTPLFPSHDHSIILYVYILLFKYTWLLFFWDRVLCRPGWPWSVYVVENQLKLMIPLPRSSKCWGIETWTATLAWLTHFSAGKYVHIVMQPISIHLSSCEVKLCLPRLCQLPFNLLWFWLL